MKIIFTSALIATSFLIGCKKETVAEPANTLTEEIKDCGCNSSEQAYVEQAGEYSAGYLYGTEPIQYQTINGDKVLEGDIIVNDLITDEPINPKAPLTAAWISGGKWPNATVYYKINSSVSGRTSYINSAMAMWKSIGVKFLPRTTQSNYVEFTTGSGCSSSIGMVGGHQYIKISSACATGNIAHEIGHALGLRHEQSRSDRNSYLTVNYVNIQSGYSGNFGTYSGSSYGTSLDFNSIMMYGSYSFSKNGQPTMVKKNGGTWNGQRSYLNTSDKVAIKARYGL